MMTDQDKSDMTLLIRAQLEEKHGKPVSGITTITVSLLAMSICLNGLLGYTLYGYRELLHACWDILP
jgi:hypothetical protein